MIITNVIKNEKTANLSLKKRLIKEKEKVSKK
jgi:hypothetical protein